MSKSLENRCVSILALAAALLIPGLLPQSAHGMYDPKHGRWLQRDPLGVRVDAPNGVVDPKKQYADGMNSHQYVASNPSGSVDPNGLWKGGDHKSLTKAAFDAAIQAPDSRPRVTASCKAYMLSTLTKANLSQDKGQGFNENRRHYNRDYKASETIADKIAADAAYEEYIAYERSVFASMTANGKDCEAGLQALGRLSHSYQDFFMHAIRRDGLGGKENSQYPGWTAWTASPAVTGDPDHRSSFYPSSYNSWKARTEGEHPNRSEPIDPGSTEGKARYNAAQAYTTNEFGWAFPGWLHFCACWCIQNH